MNNVNLKNGPFRLAPRDGKHYGTEIVDAYNERIITVWCAVGEPSRREKEYFGLSRWTPEAWAEYCSDCHWESERDLEIAEALVALLNSPDELIAAADRLVQRVKP